MDKKHAATKLTGGNISVRSFSQTPKGLLSSELIYLNTTSKETTAKIDFARPSIVTLKVFDAAGRFV
jgi:hypothetical protein